MKAHNEDRLAWIAILVVCIVVLALAFLYVTVPS